METTIHQAQRLTSMTARTLSAKKEAALSQELLRRPAERRIDKGKGTLQMVVEEQKNAERLEQTKARLDSTNAMNDIVAKEGNVEDLQSIVALEQQKEAVKEDDSLLNVMLTAQSEPKEDERKEVDAEVLEAVEEAPSIPLYKIQKAPSTPENTIEETIDDATMGKADNAFVVWLKDHTIVVLLAAIIVCMGVCYVCQKK